MLPEQTSEAWDYLRDPEALLSSLVAGRYGSPSNLL